MSIGSTLAQARRQAGLTVTEVSQRTCIRETIIRGIERTDFSACGGDFYARGHIRSIAGAVGADPGPLITEFDATQVPTAAITAGEVFSPAAPMTMTERRRPNWTAVLAVALVLAAGIIAYQHASGHSAAAALAAGRHRHPSSAHGRPGVKASDHRHARRLDIRLTAAQDCWVRLTTAGGQTIFTGTVYAGSTMTWIEHHPVTMTIGNAAVARLRVNGRNPVPRDSQGSVTLSLPPGLASRSPHDRRARRWHITS